MTEAGNMDAIEYLTLGIKAIEDGDYEKAKEVLERAMVINPKNPDVLTYYGMAVVNLGDIDSGIHYFDRAFEINAEDPDPLIYKGEVLFSLGRYEEALGVYKLALSIDPNNEYARDGLEECRKYVADTETSSDFSQTVPKESPDRKEAEEDKEDEFIVVDRESKFKTLVKRKIDILRNQLVELKAIGIDVSEMKETLKDAIMKMEGGDWEDSYEILNKLESIMSAEEIGYQYMSLGDNAKLLQDIVSIDLDDIPSELKSGLEPYYNAAKNIFDRVIEMLENDERPKAEEYFNLNAHTITSINKRVHDEIARWVNETKGRLQKLSTANNIESAVADKISLLGNILDRIYENTDLIKKLEAIKTVSREIDELEGSIVVSSLKSQIEDIQKSLTYDQERFGIEVFSTEFNDTLATIASIKTDIANGNIEGIEDRIENVKKSYQNKINTLTRRQMLDRISGLEHTIEDILSAGITPDDNQQLDEIITAISDLQNRAVENIDDSLISDIEMLEKRVDTIAISIKRQQWEQALQQLKESAVELVEDETYSEKVAQILATLKSDIDTLSPELEGNFAIAQDKINELLDEYKSTRFHVIVSEVEEKIKELQNEEDKLDFMSHLSEIKALGSGGDYDVALNKIRDLESVLDSKLSETRIEQTRTDMLNDLSPLIGIITDIKAYNGEWESLSQKIVNLKTEIESSTSFESLEGIKSEIETIRTQCEYGLQTAKKNYVTKMVLELKEPMDRLKALGIDITEMKNTGKSLISDLKAGKVDEALEAYEKLNEEIEALLRKSENLEGREKAIQKRLEQASEDEVDISGLKEKLEELLASRDTMERKFVQLEEFDKEINRRYTEKKHNILLGQLKEISKTLSLIQSWGADVTDLKSHGKELAKLLKERKIEEVEVSISGFRNEVERLKAKLEEEQKETKERLNAVKQRARELPECLNANIIKELNTIDNIPPVHRNDALHQAENLISKAEELVPICDKLMKYSEELEGLKEYVKPDDMSNLLQEALTQLSNLQEPDMDNLEHKMQDLRDEADAQKEVARKRDALRKELEALAEEARDLDLADFVRKLLNAAKDEKLDEERADALKAEFQEMKDKLIQEQEREARSNEVAPLIKELKEIINAIIDMPDIPIDPDDIDNAITMLNNYISEPKSGVLDSVRFFIDDMKSIIASYSGKVEKAETKGTEVNSLAALKKEHTLLRAKLDQLYTVVSADLLLDVEELHMDAYEALRDGDLDKASSIISRIKEEISKLNGEKPTSKEDDLETEKIGDKVHDQEGSKPVKKTKKVKPTVLKPHIPLKPKNLEERHTDKVDASTKSEVEPPVKQEVEGADTSNKVDKPHKQKKVKPVKKVKKKKKNHVTEEPVETPETETQSDEVEETKPEAPDNAPSDKPENPTARHDASAMLLDVQMKILSMSDKEEIARITEDLKKAKASFEQGNYEDVLSILERYKG